MTPQPVVALFAGGQRGELGESLEALERRALRGVVVDRRVKRQSEPGDSDGLGRRLTDGGIQQGDGFFPAPDGDEDGSAFHGSGIGMLAQPGLRARRIDRERSRAPVLALSSRHLGHRHPDPPAVAIDEADQDEGDERDGQQHGLVLDARDVQHDDDCKGKRDRGDDPANGRPCFAERTHRR